jgi:transposase
MPRVADRAAAPTAIQTDLAAIFISLELSRSIWLITSLSPGFGEKMSKHSVRSGDVAALLARFAELRHKALVRTGKSFPIIVIQEAGLDGFWLHRALEQEGIESHVVDPASIATSRRRRRAKTDKIDGETLLRAYWRISAANRGCARWSRRRRPRRKTAVVFAASARC